MLQFNLTLVPFNSAHSVRSQPHLARSATLGEISSITRLDLIHTRLDLIHTRLDLIHLTYLLGLPAGTEISTDSMEGVWFEKDPRGGAVRIFHSSLRRQKHMVNLVISAIDHRSSSLLLSLLPERHHYTYSASFLKSVLK
jgi:hypothetical protein